MKFIQNLKLKNILVFNEGLKEENIIKEAERSVRLKQPFSFYNFILKYCRFNFLIKEQLMEKISYKIDVFEGPMDLLLHLINKHKLNINSVNTIETNIEEYYLRMVRM